MLHLKFAKIAGNDISSIFTNRLIRVSVIAILIVPMLYSLCYLAAFWNPYGRLDQLPVAVLNLDEGATLDGKPVNYGDNVVDDLRGNNEVKWSFITQDDLKDGFQNTEYYSMFTIPEDFSQKIINAKTGEPTVADIIYTSNQAKNFLASQISGNVEVQLKDQVSSSVTKEYTLAAFDGLYDAKDGLSQAEDGAAELHDGIGLLYGKLPDLTDGASKLTDGSSTLNTGLTQLNSNVPALKSGSAQLSGGLTELNSQIPALTQGANQLSEGAGRLSGGIDSLEAKSSELASGVNQLYEGAQSLSVGITELSDRTSELSGGAAAVKSGTAKLRDSADALAQGAAGVSSGLDALISATSSTTDFDDAVTDIKALIDSGSATPDQLKGALDALQSSYHSNLADLNNGLQSAKGGVGSIETGLGALQYTLDPSNTVMPDGSPAFAAGVDQLTNGIDTAADAINTQLKPGADQLASGIGELDGKLPALSEGINTLSEGAHQLDSGATELSEKTPALANGVSQLATGSNALNSGINQAANGISQLTSGSSELKNGMDSLQSQLPQLTDGVTKLNDGSAELSTKLADGVSYIDGNLVNSSESMAEYISEPVSISNQPVNPVPDYGTGFAPYFIPLSLWVGAILMFFIISPRTDPRYQAGSVQSVIGKYLSYAFIGVLQAIMVGAVVLTLGLTPNNPALYFFTIIVMSLTSIAIVQALISLLGDAGRLIAIVLLILQLTADAGTFPLELVPNFFKVLNPFMPFTYCVTALREAISGSDIALIWQCIGILAIFLGSFLALSIIFKKRGEKLQDKVEQMKLA